MDMQDLVTVYTASNSPQAEIVKNFLVAEGIPCFIAGENQAAEAGLIGIAIQLQVPAAHADHARKLLASRESHRKAHGQDVFPRP
jgi:putative signal transducing protein